MKFVLISNNLTTVQKFRTDLLLEIAKKGYEIYVLAPDFDIFLAEKKYLETQGFILKEIQLQRTGTNPIADLKTVLDIYQHLVKIKPDFVLSYTIKPLIYGTISACLAGVSKRFALVSGLGFAFQEHTKNIGFVKKIINSLYKYALKRSTKVFFQNEDDRDLLKQIGILNEKTPNIIVNGSGVNTDYFYQAPLNMDANDVMAYKISFLMVARLLKDKGVYEYFEAAKIVKQVFPDVEFNLVGWVDENPAAISKLELDEMISSNIINYKGKLSDVRPAIEDSNIFVLPSYREGIPRSVLEAMSMGRAILTTNAPGCKETVIDGQNGFLVEVQSVDDLVKKMYYFINHNNLVGIMGANSRKIVLDKYDVEKVNQHMISEMQL
jgi:glycosyltransferase involved in cell wall biosynthesis